MASLTFFGAAQQVTGSCYLLETIRGRILLECGMTQGESRKNNSSNNGFAFEPKNLQAVVLSHAHLDHSGRLPLLVRQGFRGPIYLTQATHDLLEIMLKDAAYLEQKDTERKNRHLLRAGKDPIEPDYTLEDVEQTLALRRPVAYQENVEILPTVHVCFHDAGHIIGSAIVELLIKESKHTRKLVFSGDLGNSCSPLMRDPQLIDSADVLLLESTYGDRDHRPVPETLEEFKAALDAAADAGGNVLIPAFAVGRTQDLIYRLGQFYQNDSLKQGQVFLDSPMAIDVSKIYVKHTHLLNQDDPEFRQVMTRAWNEWLPILRYTRSTEESMALNLISGGAIIIAGSGMCTGGRIMHHLKHNLWRQNTRLLIAGFQARGTLGRALVDGAARVNVFGEEIAVKAKIHTLGSFSAHAGQSQLIEWAKGFTNRRPRLYLVHGEREKMDVLQQRLLKVLDWQAQIPELGESIDI